ncbi:putative transcription factor interactor and regulator CCHC(Zn) family protein [Tanacetum coccineum]
MAVGDDINKSGDDVNKSGDGGGSSSKFNLSFSDTLYLHPNDTGGSPIVTIKLTRTENYKMWSIAMTFALRNHNKLGFIDGSCKRDNKNPALTNQWDMCNSVVVTWILNSLSLKLFDGVIYAKTAFETWSDLKETYDTVDGYVVFNLHKSINSLNQNGSSLAEYYKNLNSLWKQFDAMINLHPYESYLAIRINILKREPLPLVKVAFAVVSGEESHRKVTSVGANKPTATAFVAKTFDNKRSQLVHLDVSGAYKFVSRDGFRYFLTIVDDFSRAVWVCMLKGKDDVYDSIVSFVQMLTNQFETNIKVFRSNNGTELVNNRLQNFFNDKGNLHQTSCVYIPQHNGIDERKHRHLLNVARSLMFQGELPLYLWSECNLIAVYIINKIPSSVLSAKSPFYFVYGHDPSLSHFRLSSDYQNDDNSEATSIDKNTHPEGNVSDETYLAALIRPTPLPEYPTRDFTMSTSSLQAEKTVYKSLTLFFDTKLNAEITQDNQNRVLNLRRREEKSLVYNTSFLGEYECSSLALDRRRKKIEDEI